MRLLAALFLIGCSTLSCAEEQPNYWDAKARQNGCVAELHFDLTYLTIDHEDPDSLMSTYLDFIIPNSDYDGYEINLFKDDEPRLLMSIQPVLYFTKREKGIVVSHLDVKTVKKTYKIPIDENWENTDIPRFLLAGKLAQEIWKQIVAKQAVSIEFEFSIGNHYSLDVEGNLIDQVSRMLTACAG